MSEYCCNPFEAHVDEGFFQVMFSKVDDFWRSELYDSGWGVLTLETKPIKDKIAGIHFSWVFPECDTNFMPLAYCPFCGVKLKEGK